MSILALESEERDIDFSFIHEIRTDITRYQSLGYSVISAAGIKRSIPPHKLRHFLFTWLKKQGIEDASVQPYSGHSSRQALEVYSKLSLADAQKEYNAVIDKFPV